MSRKESQESFKETGASYDQIFACSDNLGQNIWKKTAKSSKIGHDKKSLISNFAVFLTANCQNLISGRETWHCVSTLIIALMENNIFVTAHNHSRLQASNSV